MFSFLVLGGGIEEARTESNVPAFNAPGNIDKVSFYHYLTNRPGDTGNILEIIVIAADVIRRTLNPVHLLCLQSYVDTGLDLDPEHEEGGSSLLAGI